MRISRFVPYLILAITIALGAGVMYADTARAQQPREDTIVVDLVGCAGGSVSVVDGTEDSTKYTVSINGGEVKSQNLDDVTGPQTFPVYSFTASPGDVIRARLYSGNEEIDFVTRTIPACPTATPTSTATATATATNTPAATATPLPPTATPQAPVIIVNIPPAPTSAAAPVATVAPSSSVRPPSTGDGGLLP